jgi:hypothetical protein
MMLSCCCVSDYDPPTVYVYKTVRARKEYTCDECYEAISPGQQYERVRGMWDGVWETYRTCIPCVGIRGDFFSCGFIHGDMRERFADCHGFDYVDGPDEDDDDDDE